MYIDQPLVVILNNILNNTCKEWSITQPYKKNEVLRRTTMWMSLENMKTCLAP